MVIVAEPPPLPETFVIVISPLAEMSPVLRVTPRVEPIASVPSTVKVVPEAMVNVLSPAEALKVTLLRLCVPVMVRLESIKTTVEPVVISEPVPIEVKVQFLSVEIILANVRLPLALLMVILGSFPPPAVPEPVKV
jgi:hypothetical protein